MTATCRYEPGINRTYQDLAAHYDTAILPTRPRKPRDKAKVEVGVLIIERYVLARLRKRRFFSLSRAQRRDAGDRRRSQRPDHAQARRQPERAVAEIERPALKALPSERYQYAEWKKCRVAPDYHVEVDRSLLLGALAPDPRAGRSAHHRCHDRDLPQGHADRQPRALALAKPAHDHSPSTCRARTGATQSGHRPE